MDRSDAAGKTAADVQVTEEAVVAVVAGAGLAADVVAAAVVASLTAVVGEAVVVAAAVAVLPVVRLTFHRGEACPVQMRKESALRAGKVAILARRLRLGRSDARERQQMSGYLYGHRWPAMTSLLKNDHMARPCCILPPSPASLPWSLPSSLFPLFIPAPIPRPHPASPHFSHSPDEPH